MLLEKIHDDISLMIRILAEKSNVFKIRKNSLGLDVRFTNTDAHPKTDLRAFCLTKGNCRQFIIQEFTISDLIYTYFSFNMSSKYWNKI